MRTDDRRTTEGGRARRRRVRRQPLYTRFVSACAAPAVGLVAAVTVIAFGSASAQAAATCASGSYPTGNPAYQLRIANDPTGSTCVTIGTTDSSFTVNSTSNTSPRSVASRYTGFDSVYTGCNGPCYEANYERPVASYQHILTSWSFSNFGAATPGKYDAVIGMFLNTNTTQPVAQQNGAEVMVWLNHSNIDLTGQQLPDQRVDHANYHVFSVRNTTSLGGWNQIAFERVNPVSSVSNFDLVPFLQAAESDGAVLPNWYLQYTIAGFGIWFGGDGLVSNAFTANTPVLVPTSIAGPGNGGTTSKGKDSAKPNVSISYPGCSYGWTAWRCNRFRNTLSSWTTMLGFATDDVKLSRVSVTAVRVKQGPLKKVTVTARARLGSGSTWSANLKGLGYGTWKFTATAWNSSGTKRESTPIMAHITVK
jgi:Glycosyl hydrolase family 12